MDTIDWNALLKNGLSSTIDGHFQKEIAKNQPRIEQIKPATPSPADSTQAVGGAFNQNNIMIGGVTVNKTIAYATGAIMAGILIYKAIK